MGEIKYKIDGVMPKIKSIKQSFRNQKMFNALEAELADKQVEAEEGSELEQLKLYEFVGDKNVDYLATVLALTDEQRDKLYDLSFDEINEHVQYLGQRIMGMSDDEIKKAQAQGLAQVNE